MNSPSNLGRLRSSRRTPPPLGAWYDLDTGDQSDINVDAWNETREDDKFSTFHYTFAGPANIVPWKEVGGATFQRFGWIHFDTPLIASLMDYLLVTVNPFQSTNNAGAPIVAHDLTLDIHLATTDWTPASLTWSNQPSVAGDPNISRVVEIGALTSGGSFTSDWQASLDLKAMYAAAGAPASIYGLRIAISTDQAANHEANATLAFTASSTPLRGFFPKGSA